MVELSIVVISFNPPEVLEQVLAALASQVDPSTMEVIVVGRWASAREPVRALMAAFSGFAWVEAGEEDNIPRMRGRGWAHSQGHIAAWIEDDCIPDSGWCAALIESHRTAHLGIGGSVAPGSYARALDWAVFFCEFGRFIPPRQSGEAHALAGNHLSYKRQGLQDLLRSAGQDPQELFFETQINPKIVDRGLGLKLDGNLVVTNIHKWHTADVTRMPYHHGRGYAGMRLAAAKFPARLARTGGALILPILLTLRAARAVFRHQKYRAVFLQALPWVLLFYTSWAAGELVGALLGPGSSTSQWR